MCAAPPPTAPWSPTTPASRPSSPRTAAPSGLIVADTLPGAAGRRARVGAQVIVNAAGPWVDAVRALEAAEARPRLKLTRGVHLVFRRERLPISRTIIMTAADRRGVFAVPKGEATYIGTTDTFHPHAEPWPPLTARGCRLSAGDGRRPTARVAPLTPDDIASSWSGVRPLVAEEGKSASEISRTRRAVDRARRG